MLTDNDVKKAIEDAGIDAEVSSIGPDDKLADNGVDSLDFFNLFIELEEITGKKVPDEDIEKLATIRSIIEYYG